MLFCEVLLNQGSPSCHSGLTLSTSRDRARDSGSVDADLSNRKVPLHMETETSPEGSTERVVPRSRLFLVIEGWRSQNTDPANTLELFVWVRILLIPPHRRLVDFYTSRLQV